MHNSSILPAVAGGIVTCLLVLAIISGAEDFPKHKISAWFDSQFDRLSNSTHPFGKFLFWLEVLLILALALALFLFVIAPGTVALQQNGW